MIEITMNQILEKRPGVGVWDKLVTRLGKPELRTVSEELPEAADDDVFPLETVIDSNGVRDCLWCARCLPEHNDIWRALARRYARSVLHLWDAPDVVVEYLRTGGESLRAEARDEAGDAAWAAPWAAARAATGDAASVAAWATASVAVGAAAGAVAGDEAGDAAWDAAEDEARGKQADILRRVLRDPGNAISTLHEDICDDRED